MPTINPLLIRILAVVLLGIAIAITSYIKGMEHEQAKETARQLTEANAVIVITKQVAAAVTHTDDKVLRDLRAVTSERDRLSEYIKTKLREPAPIIIAGDTCDRNATHDFIRVWNSANSGEDITTGTASDLERTDTGISYIQVAEQHNRESTYCRGLEKKVMGWQSFYSQLREYFK